MDGLKVAFHALERAAHLLRTARADAERQAVANMACERRRGVNLCCKYSGVAGVLTARAEDAAFLVEQAMSTVRFELNKNEKTAVVETAVG